MNNRISRVSGTGVRCTPDTHTRHLTPEKTRVYTGHPTPDNRETWLYTRHPTLDTRENSGIYSTLKPDTRENSVIKKQITRYFLFDF